MADTAPRQISLLEENVKTIDTFTPPTKRSQIVEALKDVLFGSAAGMIGKVLEYPFDTVKVRLQSQPDNLPLRYKGPLDCFRQSLKTEGLAGLFRGISAPMVGAALETSSLFFSYRLAQDYLRATAGFKNSGEPLPLKALIFCGAASGAFTSIVLTPVELVKCQLQVPRSLSNSPRRSPASVIATVYEHHGIRGFWHGQLGTLIRETGGSAAWFGSYESVTALFKNYRQKDESSKQALPIWQQLIAGASAGMCYNFMFYPADTIKSRMQTEELSRTAVLQTKRRTFLNVARQVWHQQGMKGMYRGCGITVARSAPSSALIFTIYEGFRGLFG